MVLAHNVYVLMLNKYSNHTFMMPKTSDRTNTTSPQILMETSEGASHMFREKNLKNNLKIIIIK